MGDVAVAVGERLAVGRSFARWKASLDSGDSDDDEHDASPSECLAVIGDEWRTRTRSAGADMPSASFSAPSTLSLASTSSATPVTGVAGCAGSDARLLQVLSIVAATPVYSDREVNAQRTPVVGKSFAQWKASLVESDSEIEG
jgi:hypothetical protein